MSPAAETVGEEGDGKIIEGKMIREEESGGSVKMVTLLLPVVRPLPASPFFMILPLMILPSSSSDTFYSLATE